MTVQFHNPFQIRFLKEKKKKKGKGKRSPLKGKDRHECFRTYVLFFFSYARIDVAFIYIKKYYEHIYIYLYVYVYVTRKCMVPFYENREGEKRRKEERLGRRITNNEVVSNPSFLLSFLPKMHHILHSNSVSLSYDHI